MKVRRFSRIERRIIVLVFLAVAGVQILGEAWSYFELKRTLHQELEDRLLVTSSVTALSIARPLYERRMSQVENTFTALRSDPDFVDVTLLDSNRALQARLTSGKPVPRKAVIELSVPVVFTGDGASRRIGLLQVGFSTQRIDSQALGLLLTAAGRTLLLLSIISATLLLIARQVVRPLRHIGEAISAVRKGDFHYVPEELDRKDEIGDVLRAIEGFRQNAIEMEDLRRMNDRAARDERRRIRAALESTQDAALIMRETGQIVFQNAPARIMLSDLFNGIGTDLSLIESRADQQTIHSAIMERRGVELNATMLIRVSPTSAQRRAAPVRLRINPIYDSENTYLGVVILATDITEQVRAADHINHLANHDSLTSLANRRVIESRIEEALRGAPDVPASLFLLDLDKFKSINDTLGHPVGDELLIHVSGRLKSLIGSMGVPARLGGDEFAALFTGEDAAENARSVAGQIVASLAQPLKLGDRKLRTGASIGIANILPGQDNVSDALRKADLALYEAKRRGRGQFVEFEAAIETQVLRKARIEQEMRKDLAKKAITPVYQRQINLNTGALEGFEALARWTHAELGPISPGEFIPVAEDSNQIAEMTNQVLLQSCKAAVDWRRHGFAGRVSVNISPHLFSGALYEMIQDILLVTSCPAEALEIEITEAVLLANSSKNLDQLAQLRKLGITVALDDFGMGYSSLSYLQTFPMDRIKIDRAFVTKLTTHPETASIVRAIVELGHALGMRVTAEGVETEAQLEALRKVGADSVQGFLHGKPITQAEALADITEQERYSA